MEMEQPVIEHITPLHRTFAWLPIKTVSGKRRWLCFVYVELTEHIGWYELPHTWDEIKYYTKEEAVIKKLTDST